MSADEGVHTSDRNSQCEPYVETRSSRTRKDHPIQNFPGRTEPEAPLARTIAASWDRKKSRLDIRLRRGGKGDVNVRLSPRNGIGTVQTNYLVFLLSPDFMLSLEMFTPAQLSSLRIRTSPMAVMGVRTPPPPVFGYGSSSKFSKMASAASLVIPE